MHYAAERSGEVQMAGQPGLFDWDRRYAALSAAGDPLERLALVIEFELFRRSWNRPWRARIGPRAGGRRTIPCCISGMCALEAGERRGEMAWFPLGSRLVPLADQVY